MTAAMGALGDEAGTLVMQVNDPAINLYQKQGIRIVRSQPAETRPSILSAG